MSKVFLACTIPPSLKSYLEKMEIEVVPSHAESEIVIIDNFDSLKEFEGKGIISLTSPENWQSFISHEGRMFLDLSLIGTADGESILNRFFKQEGSSIFEENYKDWIKDDSFNISSFFSTGEYLDKTVMKAVDVGAPALEIKSALSHVFTALSFLEEENVIGLPLEISYGHNESKFAIQIHGNGKVSKESLEKLLSSGFRRDIRASSFLAALFSCDLMEVTSLEPTDKFSINLNWFEDGTLENPALILNLASHSVETEVSIEENEIDPILIQEDELVMEGVLVASDSEEEEKEEFRIEGVTEIFKDEALLIEDHSELEDFVTVVKGKFEDIGEKVTLIKGGKLDINEVVHRIAGNVEEAINETKLDIRPLEKKIKNKIRSELGEYSKSINIKAEDLSLEEIARFQVQKMPEIIRQELKTPFSKESSEITSLQETVKSLKAEIKSLRDSHKTLDKIHSKSQEKDPEEEKFSIRDIIYNAKEKGHLSEEEIENIRQNMEKEMERRTRRIEIESAKKEAMLAREIQKAKHQSRIKDVVMAKTKDSFTRILNKKEAKLSAMKQKTEQLASVAALNSAAPLSTKLKEVEKLNVNLQKQVDFYKNQTTQLATNLNSAKAEANHSEELRQLKVINQKLKTMYNNLLQEKNASQTTSALKEAAQESAQDGGAGSGEGELKRFRSLNQQLENQLKDASQKIISLEAKMVELSRMARSNNDDSSKVRIGQLEASVKKLTQDTIEAKNQVNEAKKEVNRLRQEKTFLQNQLDKLKKEAEKAKAISAKKAS